MKTCSSSEKDRKEEQICKQGTLGQEKETEDRHCMTGCSSKSAGTMDLFLKGRVQRVTDESKEKA